MNFFPNESCQIVDLFLFAHQFCSDVEHFLQSEILRIHDGILTVLEILSHKCRRI